MVSSPTPGAIFSTAPADPVRRPATEADGDAECLARYLERRDERSFERLHARLVPWVHGAAARVLARDPRRGDRALLYDLVQDVFCHLVADDARPLRAYRPERGTLRAYVARVARNRAVDHLRSGRGGVERRVAADLDAVEAGESLSAAHETRDLVTKVLGHLGRTLPRGGRRRVLEAMLEGESNRDIADRTGLSRAYIDKCTADIRRRARAWRDRQERSRR